MARVPLINETSHPELAGLITDIKARKRGILQNLHAALLHSPTLDQAWLDLIDATQQGTVLDGRTKEVAIIRIANVNRSAYALDQHVPRQALANGLTVEDCEDIASWPQAGGLTDRDIAIIEYVDSVTKDVKASDKSFEQLKSYFSDREIVELTIIAGIYNMHGRVTESLQIDLGPA